MKQEASVPKRSITSIATRNTCAICVALREFQGDLLKSLRPDQCRNFCNTHGWMVANSAPAETAAAIFLGAIVNANRTSAPRVSEQCDICTRMHREKEARLDEIAKQFRDARLHSWLRDYGVLCSRHGQETMTRLPESLRESVQEIMARTGGEIVEMLEDYLQRVKRGSHTGGGVLGRAAEFLVAQRGIES